jgi:CHASE2 domain-containing sensor protein
MSGVNIQAHMLSQLLDISEGNRAMIRYFPSWIEFFSVAVFFIFRFIFTLEDTFPKAFSFNSIFDYTYPLWGII